VNTEHLIAFWAAPPFFFASDEMPYAEFFNVLEIVDHAHAVLGSIALIQIFQSGVRKVVTIEAVLDFSVHHLLTVLDSARDANFRFEAVITSTSWAWFLVSYECTTETTVHSVGTICCVRIILSLSICRRHVRIPVRFAWLLPFCSPNSTV
jgi:hypothetical protein